MDEAYPMQDVVYHLAPSPAFAEDGVCFAARMSGLYRSDDGGATWRFVYESLEGEQARLDDAPVATTAVALSPAFASDRSVFAGVQGAVLRSVDGGQNWYIAGLGTPPPLISALVVSPDFAEDGVVLAGGMEDGIFRSSDRGGQWARWNFGLLDLNILSMAISPDFARDETLFVGTESGIFRSTNGGRAWREVGASTLAQRSYEPSPADFAPVLSLAISPGYASDGTVFAGTESAGLFCSRDRGRTWERVDGGAITDSVNAIILAPALPTAAPAVLAATSAALHLSRDGGQSWSSLEAVQSLEGVEAGISAVAAPSGLLPGAALLVGTANGEVHRLEAF